MSLEDLLAPPKQTAEWECWVAYDYEGVTGVFPTEIAALRFLNENYGCCYQVKQIQPGEIRGRQRHLQDPLG